MTVGRSYSVGMVSKRRCTRNLRFKEYCYKSDANFCPHICGQNIFGVHVSVDRSSRSLLLLDRGVAHHFGKFGCSYSPKWLFGRYVRARVLADKCHGRFCLNRIDGRICSRDLVDSHSLFYAGCDYLGGKAGARNHGRPREDIWIANDIFRIPRIVSHR